MTTRRERITDLIADFDKRVLRRLPNGLIFVFRIKPTAWTTINKCLHSWTGLADGIN